MLKKWNGRETAPAGYGYAAKDDPKIEFEKRAAAFLEDCAKFEEASQHSIYRNEKEISQHDFRVHCGWLASLISAAQGLMVEYRESLGANSDSEAQFELLQQKTDEFIARLWEWHGPPGSHADEPPSFTQAMAEVKAGQSEPFDDL
jgi:hypothetical protein